MIFSFDDETAGNVLQVGIPMKLSETPGSIRKLASLPGADTEAVLKELGYGDDEIRNMIETHAVTIKGTHP
jgi:crotonobetainyl-CoA:carnitine CoA-transferase CaiB-like acyl-CoA transferase